MPRKSNVIHRKNLFARLIDVVLWLVWHWHSWLECMSSLAALNHDRLAGRARRELYSVNRIILRETNDFNWFAFGCSLWIRRFVLHNSHATGFDYNVISWLEQEEDIRDKQIFRKTLLSWNSENWKSMNCSLTGWCSACNLLLWLIIRHFKCLFGYFLRNYVSCLLLGCSTFGSTKSKTWKAVI